MCSLEQIKISIVNVLKAINSSIDEGVYDSAADDILNFEAAMANVGYGHAVGILWQAFIIVLCCSSRTFST